MLKPYLEKVLSGQDLSNTEMDALLELLTGNEVSFAQAGAILAALRMKGESVSELIGGAQMLRRNGTFIDCGGREVVDIVGTGGDGGISFNISTTSALVAAGAGVVIAKHGNRAVSGKYRAADVLAERASTSKSRRQQWKTASLNMASALCLRKNCIRNLPGLTSSSRTRHPHDLQYVW